MNLLTAAITNIKKLEDDDDADDDDDDGEEEYFEVELLVGPSAKENTTQF